MADRPAEAAGAGAGAAWAFGVPPPPGGGPSAVAWGRLRGPDPRPEHTLHGAVRDLVHKHIGWAWQHQEKSDCL